ncbi:unnamed protein product [Camellia sinensis]
MLELPWAWEPSDSSVASVFTEDGSSRAGFSYGDQARFETYGWDSEKTWTGRWFLCQLVGLAGGLALLWPAGIQVRVQSYSVGHIDAFVEAGLGDQTWRFTGFYGNPDTSLRKDSWALLRRLAGCFQMPWLCVGDFNEILFCREKLGVLGRSQIQLDNFRHALEDTHLVDMGFAGPLFTWSNNRVGAALVRERLDRGLANDAWQGIFPHAKVYPLACTSSDHLPLYIDLCGDKAQCEIRRDTHRIYRFEAMWLQNANCEQVVTENWGPSTTTDVQGLVSNISRVSFSLLKNLEIP